MKIVHWSDFNCPNSYIGLNRFKEAVDELGLNSEWEMKPFELYPTLFETPTNSMTTEYIIKYGVTPQKAKETIEKTEEIAHKEGLEINYTDLKISSSRNAHRLIKHVQKNHPDISHNLVFKIYEANFLKNEIIADIDLLVKISSDFGLNESEIRNVLESESYKYEVQIDEEDAIRMGVQSIPLYILEINEDQLVMPGAFEKEDIKIAIKDLLSGEMKGKTFI